MRKLFLTLSLFLLAGAPAALYAQPQTGQPGAGGTSITGAGITEAAGIEQTVRESVPQPEGSSVYYDRRSGNLIVTNTADNLEAAEQLILSLDQMPMQVEIETKFVDIDMEKVTGLGVDWTNIEAVPFGTPGNTRLQTDIELTQPDRTTESFFRSLRSFSGEGLSVSFARLRDTQLRMTLEAIERVGGVNILSVPRITTLNHRQARIELINEAVEQEWREDQEYEYAVWQYISGGNTVTQEVAIPTDFVIDTWGVYLTVTPHIGADMKTVTLVLRPRITERVGVDAYGAIQYSHRDLETTVVIEDGETVAMGGLVRSKKTHKVHRVPVLGSIPGVGKLFRQDSTSDEDRNLLIFTTIHLLNPSGESIR